MCPPAPGDRRREHAWAVAGTPGNSRPSAARSGTAGAESFRAASGAERQTPTRRSPGPTNAPLRSAQSPWARLRPALASRPPLPTLPSGRGSGPGSGPCGGGSRPREAAVRPFPPVALPSPLGRSRHCTPGLPISSPRLPPTPGERAGPLLPATQRRVCVNPRPLPAGRSCRPHAESVPPPPPPGRCAPFRSRQPRRGLSRLSGAALRTGSRGEEGGRPPAALPRSELHPLAALPPSPGTVRHRGDTRRLIGRGSRAELRRATPCLGQPSAAVCFVIKSIKLLLSSETEAGGGGGSRSESAATPLAPSQQSEELLLLEESFPGRRKPPPVRERFRFFIAFRAALLRFALHCAVLLQPAHWEDPCWLSGDSHQSLMRGSS